MNNLNFNLNSGSNKAIKKTPTILVGVLLYLGYLAIFFVVWIVNNVDYTHIGKNAETTKLWYAIPTLLGSLFLVVAVSLLGWWRIILFDKIKSNSKWLWILPLFIFLLIINNFIHINTENLSIDLLLWSLLGALGVGFGEEVITRGSMVVGLRSKFTEGKVWLYSTLFFAALHIPNVIFGLPLSAMPIQVIFTFIMGSALYLIRRISGTLILPMILHGLWDSSIFLTQATGNNPSAISILVYPLAIACIIPFVYKNWNVKVI